MKLRSLVRDALYLNWAVPARELPPAPPPLSYQTSEHAGERWAFASVLLFRNRGLSLPHLPLVRLSYPQLNVRLYTRDREGVDSVLFREMLLPRWVGPMVRLVSKQPVGAARFDYPEPSQRPDEESWSWRVRGHGELAVTARRSAPRVGDGPRLGEWQDTVRFFRDRPRGYVLHRGRLRRIVAEHPAVPVWPVTAEVADASLLARSLPEVGGEGAPHRPLHSAWLCPQIPFTFVLDLVPEVELERRMPQTAPSTRAAV